MEEPSTVVFLIVLMVLFCICVCGFCGVLKTYVDIQRKRGLKNDRESIE